MARLWQSGAELASNTANMELTSVGGSAYTPIRRSGSYSWRADSGTTVINFYTFLSSVTQGAYYVRADINFTANPSATTTILSFRNSSTGTKIGVRLTTTGTLQLYNQEDGAQVGSDSSALSALTWYTIELKIDTTTLASTSVEARLNGLSFASNTVNLAASIDQIQFGVLVTNAILDIRHDNIAINNSSGSFQNSWPGEGNIIHLRPNAAGDNAGGTSSTSGSSVYSTVDEVTPNDATDFNYMSAADTIDDFNIDASPLSSGDIINVVAIGIRGANFSAVGTTGQVVVRVKASSGGTVEESANILFNTTTYFTNSPSTPQNYPLVLYDLPGGSTTAWKKSDLETAQIGYRHVNTQSTTARISAVWMSVDYTPVHTTGKMALKPLKPQINWKI